MQLFELLVDVRLDRRVADVGVDLDVRHLPDRHRVEPRGEVVHVRRNDEAAAGDLRAHQFHGKRFALGDTLHFGGGDTLTGEVLLGTGGHVRTPFAGIGRSRFKGCDLSPPRWDGHPCLVRNLLIAGLWRRWRVVGG
jgi:hypothetical protein